jgi:hypothetical protein
LAKTWLTQKCQSSYPPGSTISFETTCIEYQNETQQNGYLARADVLIFDAQAKQYDWYEIKSSTSLHHDHKIDVAFQHAIISKHYPIRNSYLVHVNPAYRRQGVIELDRLFVTIEMTEKIGDRQEKIAIERKHALAIMLSPTPPSSGRCHQPKTCPTPQLCFPELPKHSIYELTHATPGLIQQFLDQNIIKLSDIPETIPLTARQRAQVISAQQAAPIIQIDRIKVELSRLQFPAFFLDYETYAPAVPLHDGYAPYQAVTFQYSLHRAETLSDLLAGQLSHSEFLATNPTEPSQKLTTQLLAELGETGSLVVWNQQFEAGRTKELIHLQPNHTPALTALESRWFDLLELFRQGLYVDYRTLGSNSIKKVLPVLAPELNHQDLTISEGASAMTRWYQLIYEPEKLPENREKTIEQLLEYCKLDTWAMVRITQALYALFT